MNESAFGTLLSQTLPAAPYTLFPQDNFTEGVYIDYRAFDAQNITPRHEFVFGLSYTTFGYSNLRILAARSGASHTTYPTGPIRDGGVEYLWDVITTTAADVKNTGAVDGVEAAQLYVGIPGSLIRQLWGFSKAYIRAGNTATVSFDLTRRDSSVWDVVAQQWKVQRDKYYIYVGASSRILHL
ncbi:hypothetical protein ACEPPN_018934 [Leptodophora sp. 'Broadleaf-Isolate-01']